MDNYINLTDICVKHIDQDYIDHNTDPDKKPVCQVQYVADGLGQIMEVGNISDVTDILINKFDIGTQIRCIIVSTIFDYNQLIDVSTSCRFSMIKIVINYNDGQKLVPICYMILNFNFFDHIKSKQCITKYLSTKNSPNHLRGYFSIVLQFKDKSDNIKYLLLKNMTSIDSKDGVITDMIKLIKTQQVQSIIKNNIL